MAPAEFGEASNRLLVGNLGSGQIAAYDAHTGEFEGLLHGARGALKIEGLWGLGFGGGVAANGPANTLFFTAGIQGLQHGLFGTLTPAQKNEDDDAVAEAANHDNNNDKTQKTDGDKHDDRNDVENENQEKQNQPENQPQENEPPTTQRR